MLYLGCGYIYIQSHIQVVMKIFFMNKVTYCNDIKKSGKNIKLLLLTIFYVVDDWIINFRYNAVGRTIKFSRNRNDNDR